MGQRTLHQHRNHIQRGKLARTVRRGRMIHNSGFGKYVKNAVARGINAVRKFGRGG